jgi:TPP-dependent pyruvate/acetoin dehydrogenase alpha subunit
LVSQSINLGEAYRKMYLIRFVEEKLLTLFAEGKITGTVHTCIGQESSAVGVVRSLIDEDIIISNHRCHGHYLARYMDVKGLVAEMMGLPTGICGGVGGSQHLYRSQFYSNGIQGGMVPAAVGMALAEKKRETSNICAVFIGDGTFGQGIVYESLNIASLWSAPVLFVVENNLYAQSTPISLNMAGDIYSRVNAFKINTAIVGHDFLEIANKAQILIDLIRNEGKPACLIVDTYRLSAHSKGDDMRDSSEVNYWRLKDPLSSVRAKLSSVDATQIEMECEQLFTKSMHELGLV